MADRCDSPRWKRLPVTLAFTPPPCPDSSLRSLDPRGKLLALAGSALVVATLSTLLAAGLALAGSLVLVILARAPRRWYLQRLGSLGLFLVVFTLPLPFLLVGEGVLFSLGPLAFSLGGARVALLLAAKAVALVNLFLVLLVSAPLDDTLKAAHAIHVPGVLVQLGLLSYRYLFLLRDELLRIRIAMRVRGFRNHPNAHSYRTFGHVAGTLLVRGHERAERVEEAMRCRGFDGRFRSLTSFRLRLRDGLFAALLVAGSVLLVFLDRGLFSWRGGLW
jgi:cobalt/nickel transport system permease protein